MSYAADFSLATNSTFVNQVEMSMVKAAVAIASEAATANFQKDQKRNSLARQVLNSPNTFATLFAFAAVETGLTGTPTDAQVDGAVSGVWNGLAGVSSHDG